MVGLVSYGAYLPFYRLARQEISRVWGGASGAGERTVAGGDEDTVTMAVEAGTDCLRGLDEPVDAVLFASTTPPYAEKQSASLVAAALNLGPETRTADHGHSLRGGCCALRAALDAVTAGTCRQSLVVASDLPEAPPGSALERICGDGAAALAVGSGPVLAEFVDWYGITSEFMDSWRLPRDRFSQSWEERFVRDKGYLRLLPQAVAGLLQRCGLGPKDVDRVVLNAPDARSHRRVARQMGFADAQVQDPLLTQVGVAGAASSFLTLAAALDRAAPGDRILVGCYGDGADAFLLRVTPEIERRRRVRGVRGYLPSKRSLENYGKYLQFRGLTETEVDRRPAPRTSLTHYFREKSQLFGLVGQRCTACGMEQFPRQRVCMYCRASMEDRSQYEDVCLAGQKGKLFTFSMDQRAPVVDLPNVLCVVDLEGGGRYYGLMTDRDPAQIAIDQEMEFTFRKINDAQGVHNYFWKVRPVRGQE